MGTPLQTRCCAIKPEWLTNLEPGELIALLTARGFNTVILPAMQHGAVNFWVDSKGEITTGTCLARELLVAIRDHGFSVLLGVDFLSAGAVGARRLGSVADRHRNWLIRTSRGRHRVNQFPEVPGLFCWTTLEFRRFLSNLLVSIADSYPIDGIVLDLRRIPHTTNDPRSWTHLSFSCLERIPRELGIDIEDFLNQPSVDTLERIRQWRLAELHHFIGALKARIQISRQDPIVAAIVPREPRETPTPPWLDPVRRGVINEVIVPFDHEDEAHPMGMIDSLGSDPVPVLVGFETEEALRTRTQLVDDLGALGFVVMDPDPSEHDLPPPPPTEWSEPGAGEAEPIAAAHAIVSDLAIRFSEHEKFGPFLGSLDQFFQNSQNALKYEDAMKVRGDLLKLVKALRQNKDHAAEVPLVERAIRYLRLAPIGVVEY